MVIRLERLPLNIPIADKNGRPQTAFSRWWDQVLGQIEDNLTRVQDAQGSADGAQSTAEAAKATADALDAAIDVAPGKVLTVNKSMTLDAAADGHTLNIATGGTLGSAAFTASSAYVPEAPTDGTLYARRGSDASWQPAPSGGGTTGALLAANNLSDLTNATIARGNLGLSNVENKSSATIRSEITTSNVTTALGYTPLNPASNLSDVASVVTARSNLGVTASGADTAYAFRANNLSDLTNAGTARTNLGLGTAAVANTGTSGHTLPFLDGANTFSGTSTVFDVGALTLGTNAASAVIFKTNSTERARFTPTGYFKASDTGSYPSSGLDRFEFASSTASFTVQFTNSAGSPHGLYVTLSSATPNNTSNTFLYCSDSTAARAQIYSNGGLANFSANNVNLSDATVKTDVARYAAADLDALETAFKVVDWGRFKYADQSHDDWNHGYTAQGVEAAFAGVAPELVDDTDLGPQRDDGVPKLKAVYDTDLTHIGLALLSRALSRIAALEARLEGAGL